MEMKDLYRIAVEFRNAIQAAVQCGEIKNINMRDFPKGACGYASDLLQRYLWEAGIPTMSVSGQYGNGWEARNHTWLETFEGTVIDITGDQFENQDPHFSIPVYVGPKENGFHDLFITGEPIIYRSDKVQFCLDDSFEIMYRAAINHME